MLPTELLKRSVGHEWVEDFQFAFANETLYLLDGESQQIGRTVPGICIIFFYGYSEFPYRRGLT